MVRRNTMATWPYFSLYAASFAIQLFSFIRTFFRFLIRDTPKK
jgi:hypothetical protein